MVRDLMSSIMIDRRDELFYRLETWHDYNHDGELISLHDEGIKSIDLNLVEINGNLLTEASKYTDSDGRGQIYFDGVLLDGKNDGFEFTQSGDNLTIKKDGTNEAITIKKYGGKTTLLSHGINLYNDTFGDGTLSLGISTQKIKNGGGDNYRVILGDKTFKSDTLTSDYMLLNLMNSSTVALSKVNSNDEIVKSCTLTPTDPPTDLTPDDGKYNLVEYAKIQIKFDENRLFLQTVNLNNIWIGRKEKYAA